METGTKNACYISRTAQNDLLSCMKEYIQGKIIEDFMKQASTNRALFYGIQADEVRDVSNWEQLGIVIRYVEDCTPVEQLVEFTTCGDVTGEAVCQNLIKCLQSLNVDPTQCKAQTYDGASSMAGYINGCAVNFMNVAPDAYYYHCGSHSLSHALSKACKCQEIQNMMSTLQTLAIFVKY